MTNTSQHPPGRTFGALRTELAQWIDGVVFAEIETAVEATIDGQTRYLTTVRNRLEGGMSHYRPMSEWPTLVGAIAYNLETYQISQIIAWDSDLRQMTTIEPVGNSMSHPPVGPLHLQPLQIYTRATKSELDLALRWEVTTIYTSANFTLTENQIRLDVIPTCTGLLRPDQLLHLWEQGENDEIKTEYSDYRVMYDIFGNWYIELLRTLAENTVINVEYQIGPDEGNWPDNAYVTRPGREVITGAMKNLYALFLRKGDSLKAEIAGTVWRMFEETAKTEGTPPREAGRVKPAGWMYRVRGHL